MIRRGALTLDIEERLMEPAGRLARIDETLDRVMQDPERGTWMVLTALGLAGWKVRRQRDWHGRMVLVGERFDDSFALEGDDIRTIATAFFKTAASIAYEREHPA